MQLFEIAKVYARTGSRTRILCTYANFLHEVNEAICAGLVYAGSSCSLFSSILTISPANVATLSAMTGISRIVASVASTTIVNALTASVSQNNNNSNNHNNKNNKNNNKVIVTI